MALNQMYVRELVEKRHYRQNELLEIFSKDMGSLIGHPEALKSIIRDTSIVITEEMLRRFEVTPGFLVSCCQDLTRLSPDLFKSDFMRKSRNFYSIKTFLEIMIERSEHKDKSYLYEYYEEMKENWI